jgi:Ser/Thr protein kinase RdoA (MazF antagonist)
MSATVLAAVSSAVSTAILAMIGRMLASIHRDVRRFMKEHLWLLATADWTITSVQAVMHQLGINGADPPDWPGRGPGHRG